MLDWEGQSVTPSSPFLPSEKDLARIKPDGHHQAQDLLTKLQYVINLLKEKKLLPESLSEWLSFHL